MAENGSFWAKKGRVGRVNFNLYHDIEIYL